jgi:hypothetical protein
MIKMLGYASSRCLQLAYKVKKGKTGVNQYLRCIHASRNQTSIDELLF